MSIIFPSHFPFTPSLNVTIHHYFWCSLGSYPVTFKSSTTFNYLGTGSLESQYLTYLCKLYSIAQFVTIVLWVVSKKCEKCLFFIPPDYILIKGDYFKTDGGGGGGWYDFTKFQLKSRDWAATRYHLNGR
jgi:hypothetical protein